MTRWKLTFEYDGSNFSGWQRQPDQRTAEEEAERAFSTLFQTDIDIVGQGRTDAGVHARAQTAHTDLPESISKFKLIHAMRGLLPPDLALTDAAETDPDFHARFHASSRRYSYLILQRKSPLLRDRAWNCYYTLNKFKLDELAAAVTGEHNFINFCIPPEGPTRSTRCTIMESRWIKKEELLYYYIEGNRFLRHMVRRLVGSMVKVAAEKMDSKLFFELLNEPELTQKAHSAPPHGLYLEHVSYP